MGRQLQSSPDGTVLERLYRKHHRRVRWILRGRGIPNDELDDVVHDAFLAMHRRYRGRDRAIPEPSWITGVARSVASTHRRGALRRQKLVRAAPDPSGPPAPDEAAAQAEAWRALDVFLCGLDDEQRETFVLIELLGMRAAEVATLTGAGANTISSRLRLARRKFERRFSGTAAERAEFLRAAGSGERPSQASRDRTWAAVATSLGLEGSGAAATTGVGSTALSWVAAAAVVVGAPVALSTSFASEDSIESATGAATRDRTPEAASRGAALVSRTDAPSEAPGNGASAVVAHDASATTTPTLGRRADSPISHRRVPTRSEEQASPDATPSSAEEPSDLGIGLLRKAELALRGGQPRAALEAVDRYRAAFPDGPFDREALRVERRSACALSDLRRAERANSRLIELGLRPQGNVACP